MRTALETAAAVGRGEVSPVETVTEALRRAEAWQPVTNAFSALHPAQALAEAELLAARLAGGEPGGPLAGVPVAVKDLFAVAGWESTGCCRAYRGRLAETDAEVVRRVRAAGAIVIGTTNQHELAAGATNLVSACGATANPRDPGRITGGSSGGSAAAVAAGVVPLALGTDTGGSVRIPASLCGTVGLRPTPGTISMHGVMTMAPSMDTVGPLAGTVEDAALCHAVLAGGPPRAAVAEPGAVAVAEGLWDGPVHPEVREAVVGAAEALGAGGVPVRDPVRVPAYDPEDWERIAWTELAEGHGHLLLRGDELGGPTRRFLERGRDASPQEVAGARAAVADLGRVLRHALRGMAALLLPTTPIPAPPADDPGMEVIGGRLDARRGALSVLTRPANLAGLPALSVVAGWSSAEGLPLAVQLIGPAGGEEVLQSLGRLLEGRIGIPPVAVRPRP